MEIHLSYWKKIRFFNFNLYIKKTIGKQPHKTLKMEIVNRFPTSRIIKENIQLTTAVIDSSKTMTYLDTSVS